MKKEQIKKIINIALLVVAGVIALIFYFTRNNEAVASQPAPQVASTTTEPAEPAMLSASETPEVSNVPLPDPVQIAASDQSITALIGVNGAVELTINGSWNRSKSPISVLGTASNARPFDFTFGTYTTLLTSTNRPAYTISSISPSVVRLSAEVPMGDTTLSVIREIGFSGEGQARETLVISNLGTTTAVLDEGGVAFTFGAFYNFIGISQNNNNTLAYRWNNGEKVQKAKFQGTSFTGARGGVAIVSAPTWMTVSDNFFLGIIRPGFDTTAGVYNTFDAARKVAGMGVQVLATNIPAGGALQLGVDHYIGPMQESKVVVIDKNYRKLFTWWPGFNLVMKPIETGTYWVIQQLFRVIDNAGIILIIIALLVKLVLLPLSIKAAISMKKMRLLQPKINKLQEKYGNDQAVLQQKTMELYKQEKANPLGGCLPLLLQMPIFFILFRILNRSVELRGAEFLWIKDLTQPDALFMIGSFSFNLLPIIMSVLQVLTTYLQQGRQKSTDAETDMQRQMKMQGYMMPVLFLFLFWGMPSGLVLYWTAQNVFSIIEQEGINLSHSGEKQKNY
ncbi:MAG: membrane protein insertase YidC [Brevinema sp.]